MGLCSFFHSSVILWLTHLLQKFSAHPSNSLPAPSGKQLLSTGCTYDGQVCLWDFTKGVLLARASAQTELMASAFTSDGTIVTAGKEHLKVRWLM